MPMEQCPLPEFHLDDLLDTESVRSLSDSLTHLSGMPVRIFDAIDGRALAGAPPRKVEALFRCARPDRAVILRREALTPAERHDDDDARHRCSALGFWTIGVPIVVGGDHLGSLLLGPFRYDDEEPGVETRRSQAARCGIDEAAFLESLECVPSISRSGADAATAGARALARLLAVRAAERRDARLASGRTGKDAASDRRRRRERGVDAVRRQARLATECRFDVVMHSAEIGYYDYFPSSGGGYISPIWFGMLGHGADEFPHTHETFEQMIHPDDRAAVGRAIETGMASDQRFRVIFRARHKDGSIRWVDSIWRTLERDDRGRARRVLGVNLDVTARQEQAELIRCFETISDSIDDQHYVTDRDLRIRQANQAFLDAFEVTREDALGRHPWDLARVSERDRVREGLMRSLAGKTDVQEYWYRFREHEPGYYRVSRYPVRDADGEITGVAVTIHDLTEIQQVRDELHAANTALAATSAELQARNRELEDAIIRVKRLRGLLPICASCKKIRDERDYWRQVDEYVSEHSEAEFTHSICPDCAKHLYPELDADRA